MATVREVGEGDFPVLEFAFKMIWTSYTYLACIRCRRLCGAVHSVLIPFGYRIVADVSPSAKVVLVQVEPLHQCEHCFIIRSHANGKRSGVRSIVFEMIVLELQSPRLLQHHSTATGHDAPRRDPRQPQTRAM